MCVSLYVYTLVPIWYASAHMHTYTGRLFETMKLFTRDRKVGGERLGSG